jgi:2-oxoglutarate ferredoxin oxidoreductase subunit beta
MNMWELNDPEYFEALLAATAPETRPDAATDERSQPVPAAATAADTPGVADSLLLYGAGDPLAGLLGGDLVTATGPRQHRLLPYLRREILPTTFCVGCGGGTVLNAFTHAVDEMRLDPREMVCVTGIGCSSWIPSPYFRCDTLHTTHGRAVAFANGVKIMRPDMKVIVIAGDGDLAGIGGNHLIHAARRNIDLSVFLVNNFIYGMTGGQVSPTTPFGVRTTTTPYRNVEHPFRIADVVAAAGGSYVARWTTFHPFQLMEAMQYAIHKKGFSFVEIISQCPVSYGKMTRMSDPVTFLEYFRDASIHIDDARQLSEEELADKIVVGKLVEREQAEFGDCLQELNRERQVALRERYGIAASAQSEASPAHEPSDRTSTTNGGKS